MGDRFEFEAEVIYWRGPAPFFFVPVPAEQADMIRGIAKFVTYGWGMIPVAARIGEADFTTALFPKDGTYFLPLKDAVRRKANVTVNDTVSVNMHVQARQK